MIPVGLRMQQWYGTLGQWMHHSEHGVRRLEKMKMLVEVPGSAFSTIPSKFIAYRTGQLPAGERWLGHYETAHARILGWMDRTGRVWWAKQP
jgi:hypothetical protein